jgi:hypothetical protein
MDILNPPLKDFVGVDRELGVGVVLIFVFVSVLAFMCRSNPGPAVILLHVLFAVGFTL